MSRLLLLFFFLSSSAYSQLTQEDLILRTLKQLKISKSEVPKGLTTSRNFDSETLMVIPVISEEGEGYMILNAYLVLVDSQTGHINSKYFGKKEWYSDAHHLTEINIHPEIYKLGSFNEAFGIRINYSGNSRANPYHDTKLSLYVKEETGLKRVLGDYRVYYFKGETDTNCNGEFETHSKTLEIANLETNGYADLKFTDAIEKSVSTDENCDPVVGEIREETEILKFRNGSYGQF